ncbi:MAG: ATP-binding protein [Bacteroidia bacterium]
MEIQRTLFEKIKSRLFQGKVILILGPRQVGKTTLVRSLVASSDKKAVYFNADEPNIPPLFSNRTSAELKTIIGSNKLVVIDEAQRIKNIGLSLKLLIDTFPDIQVIATGSSALELGSEINEPLTGRKFEFFLFPVSQKELTAHEGLLNTESLLNFRLIFGTYPEVVTAEDNQEELLKLIADSYLYKDLYSLEDIRKPDLLKRILQALAFQVGSEVSYHEIAQLLGADKQTVERYIYLLEKSFVIFRLGSFSRNLRNELKRSRKIYFWDNGIRNALVSNFNHPELRDDVGALWENFLISERMKQNHYEGLSANTFFWRTHAQQEVDYLEERGGTIHAYEFTWNPKKKKKFPKTFLQAYPGSETMVVHRKNWQDYIDL